MLDNESRAAMLDKVSQDFGPEQSSQILSVDSTSGGSVQEIEIDVDVKPQSADPEVEENVSVETTEKVEVGDDSPTPKGHKVPYSRFKNVLESRNQFRTEVETYKDKLTSLEAKLQNLNNSESQHKQNPSQKPQESKTWLDDYLASENQTAGNPEWKEQYGSLNDRLYKFEVAQEEQNLRAELSDINSKFPNVPQNVLLKAVIEDPNANMNAIAEQYSTFMAGIEEKAIANYLAQGGQAQAASPTPEPLQRPRSLSAPRGNVVPESKPSSVGEATKALRSLLTKNNFLKD